jgi:hypothetical protein
MIKFELNTFKDTELSQIFCREFLDGCECPVIYKNDYLVIFEDTTKAEEKAFSKSKLEKMKKSDLWAICDDIGMDWLNNDDTKAEIIAELTSLSKLAYYERLADNLGYQSDDYNFIITGYSQGDSVKVRIVGKAYHSQDYLTNLFYDTLCYCRLTVLNVENSQFAHNAKTEELEEIDLAEFLSNNYEWSKEEVINGFKNSSYSFDDYDRTFGVDVKAEIVAYLEQNLPDELNIYK